MSILKEVLSDLLGMFIADARMSAAILLLVALVALALRVQFLPPLLAGLLLLGGCLALILISTVQAARQR